jgi:hypothetical protein
LIGRSNSLKRSSAHWIASIDIIGFIVTEQQTAPMIRVGRSSLETFYFGFSACGPSKPNVGFRMRKPPDCIAGTAAFPCETRGTCCLT